METAIELTKKEATKIVLHAFSPNNENFYNVDIQLQNGVFVTATPENINEGVKFWLIK